MTKKPQKPKRRQKERRKRQNITKLGMEALRRKVRSSDILGDREVVFQTGLSEKMSEVLMAFVEPYQKYATTRDTFERLIAVAAVAWNVALASPEARRSLLDETSKSIEQSAGKEEAVVYRDLVNELIERKERYFANNKRLILGYEVTTEKGRFHLAVASSVGEQTS